TTEDILEFIRTGADEKQCEDIGRAAGQRKRALQDAERQRDVDNYWKTLVYLRKGDTVYCGALGRFYGGPLQPGDKAKVWDIELGRRNMLWLQLEKGPKHRAIGFGRDDAFLYRLQRNKP